MNTRILPVTLLVGLCLSSCSKWDQSPGELTLDLGKGVTMKLVRIPAGEFLMGSPPTEIHRYDDEGPQRQVTIGKPFYMGVCEVTQAQWRGVIAADSDGD